MFKIITKREYNKLLIEIETYKNMLDTTTLNLMSLNQDYELKINDINNKLKDIANLNSKTKKDVIIEHIKSVIKFIEKGKE